MLAYCSDGLHAEHKRVAGQITRVGHGVFFPQLPEKVLPPGHACVVEREVAFEEEVDGAAYVRSRAMESAKFVSVAMCH